MWQQWQAALSAGSGGDRSPRCPRGLQALVALSPAGRLSLWVGMSKPMAGGQDGDESLPSREGSLQLDARMSQTLPCAPAGPLGCTLHLAPWCLGSGAPWEGPCGWNVPGTLSPALS